MLSDEKIAELKIILQDTQKKLEDEIDTLSLPVDMGDDIDSYDEEADEAEEFSANLGMAKTLKARLLLVKDALTRIEDGTYGTCSGCNKDIVRETLEVNPESDLCRECKIKQQ